MLAADYAVDEPIITNTPEMNSGTAHTVAAAESAR
jgi:hypothetical protein